QSHDLDPVVARLLVARGITSAEASDYLTPTLRSLMPDPSVLKDMDKAAAAIAKAIREGQRIAIFGDYDVDGATSAALCLRVIRALTAVAPILYVPDRLKEGYGPNPGAMRSLRESGADLVISVDCGIVSFDAFETASEIGLDAIVIDHHAAEARLPKALAIVNPNRLDDDSNLGNLAACGVVFLTLVSVLRQLREAGFFEGRNAPNLLEELDLVALGTVCDVVPLVGLNRAFAIQGLKVMAQRQSIGIDALMSAAGLVDQPSAYHLGYVLGPRINAAGRIGEADLGAKLLSTDDAAQARRIASQLNLHNEDRKTIQEQVLAEATGQIEAGDADQMGVVIVVAGEGWHPGVIGVVASRLRELYDRPTCVVAIEGGLGKGSGRSMPGIDLGSAVIEARQAGLLLAGGGHRMAAGFTVEEDKIDQLRAHLNDHIAGQEVGPPVPVLECDGALAVSGADITLAQSIEGLGPFGPGNEEPRFVLRHAQIVRPSMVGNGHVRCFITGGGAERLKAIAFRAADTPLGQALLAGDGVPIHLAGVLRVDRWQGRLQPQFQIEDAAPAWST
ncbi:MAG: single-stranded-DNA-specific exonuclease RecJ, partial [Pseudomonadota bacterium]